MVGTRLPTSPRQQACGELRGWIPEYRSLFCKPSLLLPPSVLTCEVERRLDQEQGINNFVFHDLRHCAVTNLADAGVDIETIMKIVGRKGRMGSEVKKLNDSCGQTPLFSNVAVDEWRDRELNSAPSGK